jgi:hypothetical protein
MYVLEGVEGQVLQSWPLSRRTTNGAWRCVSLLASSIIDAYTSIVNLKLDFVLLMSTRKSLSTRVFTLPGDASWLEFERSDGDPSTWPAEVRTERVVDKDGHVNFYRIIDLEESQGVRWRMEVGAAVAKQMNMPGTSIRYPVVFSS